VQGGIGEESIDRANLTLLNQSAQPPVPHRHYVQPGFAGVGAVIKIAHNRPVIFVQNPDVNATLLLEDSDHPSRREGIEEPFVSCEADRDPLASQTVKVQEEENE
jgi:hypothetical protein